MKIGSLVAVVVVVLAVLAAPFGFGYWADARLDRLIAEISKNGVFHIDVITTHRGWLESTSDLEVELRGDIARKYQEYQRKAGGEAAPLRCTVRNHIHHGPWPLVDGSKPSVAVIDSELVAGPDCKALQDRLKLAIRTRFDFDGGGTTHVALPKQTVTSADNGTIDWHGLNADVSFDNDFQHVKTEMVSPGLDVSDASADVSVRDLKMNSDAHQGIEGLDLGTFSLTVGAVEIAPKSGDALKTTLTKMELRGSSAEGEQATVNTEVTMSAEKISAGDLQLGPARYVLALRNMDAAALAKLERTIADARSKNLPEQQAGMMIGATLLGMLPDILKKGPVVELSDLSIASPQGTAKGAATLTIDTTDPAVFQNPLLLSQALVADAHLDVPEALLVALAKRSIAKEVSSLGSGYSDEQIEAMARMRVRQGMASDRAQQWFVLDNGVYRMKLHMEQGRFSLNGRAIQPGSLTGG